MTDESRAHCRRLGLAVSVATACAAASSIRPVPPAEPGAKPVRRAFARRGAMKPRVNSRAPARHSPLLATGWRRILQTRRPMPDLKSIIHSDPGIHSVDPVFVVTRVPVSTLLDYIEGGDSLEVFLDNFPSVSREQAIAFLEEAGRAALAQIA